MSWPWLRVRWGGVFEIVELDDAIQVDGYIPTTETWAKADGSVKVEYCARVDKYEFSKNKGELHLHYEESDQTHSSYLSRKRQPFHWGTWEFSWSRVGNSSDAIGDAVWRDNNPKDSWRKKGAVKVFDWASQPTKQAELEVSSRIKRPKQKSLKELLLSRDKKCAITNEMLFNVLDAAHIVPATQGDFGLASNAILLRADLHRLFDDQMIKIECRGDDAFFVGSKGLSPYYKQLLLHAQIDPKILKRIAANIPKRAQAYLK